MTEGARAGAGSGPVHALPLAAITILVLNDHLLKSHWGHPVTGILSDLAGLAFFPLLLIAFLEVGQHLLGRYRGPDDRALVAAVAATALAFALVQTAPPAAEAYRHALAVMRDPLAAFALVVRGESLAALPSVAVTPDLRDLLALPAVLLALWVGRASSRLGSSGRHDHEGGRTAAQHQGVRPDRPPRSRLVDAQPLE